MSRKIHNLQSTALSPAEIIEAELNCELDILRPKSMLSSVIKKRQSSGKQTTVVTDTYYEREHVERILTKAGISLEFLDLQVSSETGLRKDNSSYWAVLAESMRDFEGSYLHVGDNLVADVQLPSDFGFRTFYLPNARDLGWMLGSDIPNDISVIADEFVQSQLNLYQNPIFTASGVQISGSTIE
jgi:predicted HAD superfamily hydrolase